MKVLIVNTYHYLRGGDCRHAIGLGSLLKENGYDVHYFAMKGKENLACEDEDFFIKEINYRRAIQNKSILDVINVTKSSIYSTEAKKKISLLLDKVKPDIAHLHSIRHHLTKSILPEISKRNIPIVWTLHDYKELCPNTSFYNGQTICEKCKGKKYYNVVVSRCKKQSLLASILTYLEAKINSHPKYEKCIGLYISPSCFLRNKFLEYGYPSQKLLHLPNFIEVDNIKPKYDFQNYMLYLGRLEKEKGLETLIRGFAKVNRSSSLVLRIAGAGTLEDLAKKLVDKLHLKNVYFEGYLDGNDLGKLIHDAKAIIIPSEWYENYPFSGLEAMAFGKPVIASRIGGLPEIVEEGMTGYLFEPFDANQLSEKISLLDNMPKNEILKLGENARKKVEFINDKKRYLNRIVKVYKEMILQKRSDIFQ